MGLAVASTASACRRIASLLVPEVPGRLGPPAGASAGCDGAGAGLPNAGGLDGAATHQPGCACLRTVCGGREAGFWRMRRPAAPRRSWRSHRSRLAARRERRFDPRRWRWFWGCTGFRLEGLWRHAVRGRFLLEASPVVVGASWFSVWEMGRGPWRAVFRWSCAALQKGALVSDRRPGPGSGSRSTRLTAGGGVPGADRQEIALWRDAGVKVD